MAGKKSKSSMGTGTKVAIGLVGFLVLFVVLGGGSDDDAWSEDDSKAGASDDAGGADLDLDDPGDDVDVPADDPWTRGSDASSGDDDDDDGAGELPADDPWTRGRDSGGGRGTPHCVGAMAYDTDDGRVLLPTDRPEEAFASADCIIVAGQSGSPVWVVENALAACNQQTLVVDGVEDEQMRAALSAVQAVNGLTVDGGYGPATREVMAWPTEPEDGGPIQCIPRPDVG